jgi:Flp pilus assembly protein protease CpaA
MTITTKNKLKSTLPYVGLPIIIVTLLLVRIDRVETFDLLRNVLLAVFGYFAAVGDLKSKKIPNTLVLAMLAGWVILTVPQLFVNIEAALSFLLDAAIGFALGGGLFLLVYLFSRKGIGGGDVKFMAVSGLYLGLSGVITAMFCGTVLAGLAALVLLLLKRIGRKDSIPLAPFLYAGILITLFFT